jgi:creatine kinase
MEKLILQHFPKKNRNSSVSKLEFLDFQKSLLGNDVESIDALMDKYGLGGLEAPVVDAGDMFSMEADSGGDQSAPPSMEMPVLTTAAAAKSGPSISPKEAALTRRAWQLKPADRSSRSPKENALIRRAWQVKSGTGLSPKEDALIRRSWQLKPAALSPKESALLRRSYQLPKQSPKENALLRRSYQLPKPSPKENALARRSWQLKPPTYTPKESALIRRSYQLPKQSPKENALQRRTWQVKPVAASNPKEAAAARRHWQLNVDTLYGKKPSCEVDPYREVILIPDLAQNKYPKEMLEGFRKRHAEGEKMCQMVQRVTEEMFNACKDKTSGGPGNWTVARAMNSGMTHPTCMMGCHVGDTESYDTFIEVYKPLVEGYHQMKWDPSHSTPKSCLDPKSLTQKFTPEAAAMVASTRVRVARNLASPYILNPAGTKESRIKVLDAIRGAMDKCEEADLKGQFYVHAEMSAEKQQELIDGHFLFNGHDKRQAAAGYHQFWPHGRGIFQAVDKEFNIWVNEGDHYRFMVLIPGPAIEKVLDKLNRAVAVCGKNMATTTGLEKPYAEHPILGMISCCPSNLGTGCRTSVHMKLPNLVEAIGFNGIKTLVWEKNCQARGSGGETDSSDMSTIDISNRRRLGFSEVQLADDMIMGANYLADLETKAGKGDLQEVNETLAALNKK